MRIDGSRKTLTTLPKRLAVGDLREQGLPFYGGTVRYRLPLPQPVGEERTSLELPEFEAALAKLVAPDGERMLAWPPHRAEVPASALRERFVDLDLVLTRRNTFGPLHLVPPQAPGYGPDSFVTSGSRFTLGYALWPSGLLRPPRILTTVPSEEAVL